MSISENIAKIKAEIPPNTTLVAISKTKPLDAIMEAYQTGHRIFGENKVQEMTEKWEKLPKDIQWHMVGHLQRNKVKYMAPFVALVHGVDSLKLLKEINKQAKKNERVISCLLQVKIAEEDSKFGLKIEEVENMLNSETVREMENIKIEGFMGMATFTEDADKVSREFQYLNNQFHRLSKTYPTLKTLSMGMSGDYKIALENGSTMVRVGSAIFGERKKPT